MTTFKDYTFDKVIGEGAFGRTYLVHHTVLGFKACLKQLSRTDDPLFIDSFREEAEILSKVRHRFLPALLGYWEEPDFDRYVLAMSFIEGTSLQDLIDEGKLPSDEHICWILDRVLEALSYLHYRSSSKTYDRGIIHCDIKPANILLNIPEHEAYVVDLGMAFARPTAASLAKGGTDDFMPPEFSLGKPPIPASDIFSLGKTAIALAGGNIKNGQCPDDMNPHLQEFIDKMILRDPRHRFQVADQARSSLRKVRVKAFGGASSNEMFKTR